MKTKRCITNAMGGHAHAWRLLVRALLTLFLVLSIIGLALSLAAHIAALLGLPQPLGAASGPVFFIGMFAVGLPTCLVSRQLDPEYYNGQSRIGIRAGLGIFIRLAAHSKLKKDPWKAVLRGCPHWMRLLTYWFLGYAFVYWLMLWAMALTVQNGAPDPNWVIRGLSAFCMGFYSLFAATLYSAIVVAKSDSASRCPNGHPVSPPASATDDHLR